MGRKSKGKKGWLLFILFFWFCYQCWSNIFRYYAVTGNMTSLAVEINTLGPDGFKKHFISVLAKNDIVYSKNDINISVNNAVSLLEVTVPFVWKVNFGVWAYEHHTLLQTDTHKWPDGLWPS